MTPRTSCTDHGACQISGLLGPQTDANFRSPDLFPFRGLAQRFLPLERIREICRRATDQIVGWDNA